MPQGDAGLPACTGAAADCLAIGEHIMSSELSRNASSVDQVSRWEEIQALSRKVASQDRAPTEVESALCGAVVRAREWLEELEATKELLAASRSEKPATWIQVSERMPEMIGNYLVTNEDGLRTIAWAFFNSRGQWCGYNTYYKNVTHWMPLPEAPK
jgi:hypothetical protein